jgi:hypothetical protein
MESDETRAGRLEIENLSRKTKGINEKSAEKQKQVPLLLC